MIFLNKNFRIGAILGLLSLCLVLLSFVPNFKKQDDKIIIAKPVSIKFKIETSSDATLPEGFADTLRKVEDILSKIFSSQDFKDALYKRSFSDSSFSKSKKGCFELAYEDNGRVSGKGVYENITRNKNISIEWSIKKYTKGPKTSTMGFSNACVDKITSYDYWIKNDQYLSLRMVRHLAHEFTHVCGYRHDGKVPKAYKWDKKDDPAYGVGGIVGDIMLNWAKKGLLEYN